MLWMLLLNGGNLFLQLGERQSMVIINYLIKLVGSPTLLFLQYFLDLLFEVSLLYEADEREDHD
jgi:hypothetical protein